MVYAMTPRGIRKPAAVVLIPVSAFTVAAPPRTSMEETMMLVMKQKMNTFCTLGPQRASMISQMVWAFGA